MIFVFLLFMCGLSVQEMVYIAWYEVAINLVGSQHLFCRMCAYLSLFSWHYFINVELFKRFLERQATQNVSPEFIQSIKITINLIWLNIKAHSNICD